MCGASSASSPSSASWLCSRPSPVLLSCGIPLEVARNALRLSVGRGTARADVDRAVQDLVQAVEQLERDPAP